MSRHDPYVVAEAPGSGERHRTGELGRIAQAWRGEKFDTLRVLEAVILPSTPVDDLHRDIRRSQSGQIDMRAHVEFVANLRYSIHSPDSTWATDICGQAATTRDFQAASARAGAY